MKKSSFILRVIFPLLLLAIAAALAWKFWEAKSGANAPVPVKTTLVGLGSVSNHITATGNVIARKEITVNSLARGQIKNMEVQEGSTVQRNQVLVQQDQQALALELDQSRIAITQARQNRDSYLQDLRRLEQIYALGGEAKKNVDAARLRWQNAVQELANQEQSLKIRQHQERYYTVRAPIGGVVTQVLVRQGMWAEAGQPILKISEQGGNELEINLDSADSQNVHMGQVVKITSEAMPGKEWHEPIKWIAPTTRREGSANILAVRINAPADLPMVLGQQVDVLIPTQEVKNVPVVPTNLLLSRQGKPTLPVVRDGKLAYQVVEVGLSGTQGSHIKSGIQANQEVVILDGKELAEGTPVQVTQKPLTPPPATPSPTTQP